VPADIRKQMVNLGELATVIGVSMQTVREFHRKGVFKASAKGRYNLVNCTVAYFKHIRDIASGRDIAKDPSRVELASAQAAVARAKAGVLSGKLVDVKEIEAEVVTLWRKCRSLMLALPARVANRAVGMSREDVTLIDEEVREVLTEMANADYTSPSPAGPEVGEDVPAAKKAKAKRVDRGHHQASVRRKRTAR
jgi:terminase small subunit / prophage DNA-packing protein